MVHVFTHKHFQFYRNVALWRTSLEQLNVRGEFRSVCPTPCVARRRLDEDASDEGRNLSVIVYAQILHYPDDSERNETTGLKTARLLNHN